MANNNTVKLILILVAVFAGVPMLACGGCFLLVGKGISEAKLIRDKKLSAMTPEQRKFYDLEKDLEKDAFQYKRYLSDHILKSLKSPKTATFDLSSRAAESKGDRAIFVSGTVAVNYFNNRCLVFVHYASASG